MPRLGTDRTLSHAGAPPTLQHVTSPASACTQLWHSGLHSHTKKPPTHLSLRCGQPFLTQRRKRGLAIPGRFHQGGFDVGHGRAAGFAQRLDGGQLGGGGRGSRGQEAGGGPSGPLPRRANERGEHDGVCDHTLLFFCIACSRRRNESGSGSRLHRRRTRRPARGCVRRAGDNVIPFPGLRGRGGRGGRGRVAVRTRVGAAAAARRRCGRAAARPPRPSPLPVSVLPVRPSLSLATRIRMSFAADGRPSRTVHSLLSPLNVITPSLSPLAADAIAGAAGELVQIGVLYPLDTIKVICQAADCSTKGGLSGM